MPKPYQLYVKGRYFDAARADGHAFEFLAKRVLRQASSAAATSEFCSSYQRVLQQLPMKGASLLGGAELTDDGVSTQRQAFVVG